MNGGFWDKLGNEYERDYVCLQWLRLLGEHVDAVTWEAAGSDEPGVDVWLERDGRRIAVQCKTRSGGQWNVSALTEFLPAVRKQLERPGGADSFVFATNQSAPPLAELRAWAESPLSSASLGPPAGQIATKLGFDPDGDLAELRALARCIDVDVQTDRGLDERVHELAAHLAGDDGERLVHELKELHITAVGGRKFRAHELRAKLPDLRWRQSVDSRLVLDQLDRLQEEFIEDIRSARRIPGPPLGRPETRALLDLVERGPGLVLVHGDVGAGKSEVLASAVERWPADRGLVVPIRADECARLLDGGDLALEKVIAAGGAGRVTLVIDQLDQLRQAGLESQRLGRDASRLVRNAYRLGCGVIVGCRTVDAQHDTQLHNLLRPAEGFPPEQLIVGDLPERQVTDVLSEAGIAWNTLGPSVRQLVRRPLGLVLLLDFAGGEGWQGARSLYDLVGAWWAHVVDEGEAKERAMEALIGRMERDGSFSVDRRLLQNHGEGIAALLDDGMLQATSDGRVRPVHQVLVDMLLARALGGCDGAEDVLERIGERRRQGVHEARRLRLATSLFAARDSGGATILDTLYRSEGLRPLLKRALLLGLADDPSPPSAALTRVVLHWLDDREQTFRVAGTLLHGRGNWVLACRAWLESAWGTTDEELQGLVLQILASVSTQEGDIVAELLGEWTHDDPETWEWARSIFWQDPTDDTDALFEMRDRAPGRMGFPQEYPNWERLIGDNPERAARTLVRRLESASSEELARSARASGFVVPNPALMAGHALGAANRMWQELGPWWNALVVDDLAEIATQWGNLAPAPLVNAVELLARCLGHLLERRELSWNELIEQLPSPLRELDGWLLLEVGGNLDGQSPDAAEAASRWLVENERFVELRVGRPGRWSEYRLARPFVRAIAPHLSEAGYARLERWILQYREEWSTDHEELRLALAEEHGAFWPNERGLLCYRLLPELPAERLTLAARSRLNECRRKFDPVANTMPSSLESGAGWLGSKIPDHVALRFTPEEWGENLQTAPTVDPRLSSRGDDRIAEHTLESLSRQLFALARADPRQFLSTARALASADMPRLQRGDFYGSLLQAVSTTSAAGGAPDSEWAPAADGEVESLLRLPAFLRDEGCAIEIGRTVQQRAEHPWSPDVIDRLVEIATVDIEEETDPVAAVYPRGGALTACQWNDSACAAVRALALLASNHPEHGNRFLDVAEGLVDIGPLARRAAAGVLAVYCDRADPDRARGLLLTACRRVQVAADRDCLGALFWVLGRPETTPALQAQIVATLQRLVDGEDAQVAERGGGSMIELRSRGLLDGREAWSLLENRPAARKGAATQLGRILTRGTREPWVFDDAVEFANDPDPDVGEVLLLAAVSPRNRALLTETDFGSRLVRTAAATRHRDQVLYAFDEEAELRGPVAELVFEVARSAPADRPASDPDEVWSRFDAARRLSGLLARLVEECERSGDDDTRARALDEWDALLSRRPFETGSLVAALTDPAG